MYIFRGLEFFIYSKLPELGWKEIYLQIWFLRKVNKGPPSWSPYRRRGTAVAEMGSFIIVDNQWDYQSLQSRLCAGLAPSCDDIQSTILIDIVLATRSLWSNTPSYSILQSQRCKKYLDYNDKNFKCFNSLIFDHLMAKYFKKATMACQKTPTPTKGRVTPPKRMKFRENSKRPLTPPSPSS